MVLCHADSSVGAAANYPASRYAVTVLVAPVITLDVREFGIHTPVVKIYSWWRMELNRKPEWEESPFPPEGLTKEEYDRWYLYQVELGLDDVAQGAVVDHEKMMQRLKLKFAKAMIKPKD